VAILATPGDADHVRLLCAPALAASIRSRAGDTPAKRGGESGIVAMKVVVFETKECKLKCEI
jgi:hypothetical protein